MHSTQKWIPATGYGARHNLHNAKASAESLVPHENYGKPSFECKVFWHFLGDKRKSGSGKIPLQPLHLLIPQVVDLCCVQMIQLWLCFYSLICWDSGGSFGFCLMRNHRKASCFQSLNLPGNWETPAALCIIIFMRSSCFHPIWWPKFIRNKECCFNCFNPRFVQRIEI